MFQIIKINRSKKAMTFRKFSIIYITGLFFSCFFLLLHIGQCLSLSDKKTKEGSDDSFVNDCLNAHNKYRKRHRVPPLILDPKICEDSQSWANHLAELGIFKHSPPDMYGENIYSAFSSNPKFRVRGSVPVDSWYDEIKYYKFGVEPSNSRAFHFTQVIWKASKKLGVGMAKGLDGRITVVAKYFPAGNLRGAFTKNVPSSAGGRTLQHDTTNVLKWCGWIIFWKVSSGILFN